MDRRQKKELELFALYARARAAQELGGELAGLCPVYARRALELIDREGLEKEDLPLFIQLKLWAQEAL